MFVQTVNGNLGELRKKITVSGFCSPLRKVKKYLNVLPHMHSDDYQTLLCFLAIFDVNITTKINLKTPFEIKKWRRDIRSQ